MSLTHKSFLAVSRWLEDNTKGLFPHLIKGGMKNRLKYIWYVLYFVIGSTVLEEPLFFSDMHYRKSVKSKRENQLLR